MQITKKTFQAARHWSFKKISNLVDGPNSKPVLSEALYKAGRRYAELKGVNPIFLDRADAILAKTGSRVEALRFIRTYISLAKGQPIAGFNYDLSNWLESDAEKKATEAIIQEQLNYIKDGRHADHLQMQLFRLQKAEPDDEKVVEFARDMLERVIAKRMNSFQGRKKHFTVDDASQTLITLKKIFDQKEKRFFLDRGTLLGAVRENGFIATDYDIDLGVFAHEISLDEIKDMLKETDFTLNQDCPYKLGYISPAGIQVDFFLTERENNLLRSSGWNSVHVWYFSDFELIEYEFLGQKFYIPDNYEQHLVENYGNWRTPNLFYDPSYDEPCGVYGSNINALFYLLSRSTRAIENGRRFDSNAPLNALRDVFNIDYTDYLPQKIDTSVDPLPPKKGAASPIIFLGVFDKLEPDVLRTMESAAHSSNSVIVGVLSDKALRKCGIQTYDSGEHERSWLMKTVRFIDDVFIEDSLFYGAKADLCAFSPQLVVIDRELEPYFSANIRLETDVITLDRYTNCLKADKNRKMTTGVH